MARAVLNSGTHNPKCSGCPVCSDEMASLLTMKPVEYAAWLTERTAALRTNTAGPRLRVAGEVPKPPSLTEKLQEEDRRYLGTTPPHLAARLTEHARRTAIAAHFTSAPKPISKTTAPRAAARGNVPAAPSLRDAILKQREGK